MLFELSEARRPVNLKERVKDRVSRNTLSSSSSTCCTKHTASRKYCVWRRACVPGARSGTSLRQIGSSLPAYHSFQPVSPFQFRFCRLRFAPLVVYTSSWHEKKFRLR